jgi:hypothetical protein
VKICQCYHTWGKESEDCEVGFDAKHPNEQFCDPCKPIAQLARVAYSVQMYRQRKKQAGYDYDITLPDWKASWIDRKCTCCGVRGVPTFNRFLCITCWTSYADGDYTLHLTEKNEISWAEYDESPSHVRTYGSWQYTQKHLWKLVRECRTGWKDNMIPLTQISARLRAVLRRMGHVCSD